MPFNDIISRADADVLIPQDVSDDVIKTATQSSAALALCRRATMSAKTETMPVLSALAVAYGDVEDTMALVEADGFDPTAIRRPR